MDRYHSCPNCGNIQHSDSLYRCYDCGTVFCSACGGGSYNKVCPKCTNAESINAIQDLLQKAEIITNGNAEHLGEISA